MMEQIIIVVKRALVKCRSDEMLLSESFGLLEFAIPCCTGRIEGTAPWVLWYGVSLPRSRMV